MMVTKMVSNLHNAIITLGNFDGMHLGHMRLIAALTRRAAELGAPALVYTFDEHPRNVLEGAGSVKLLTDTAQKLELLSDTAVDGVYIERFDQSFSSLSPEEFARIVLVNRLKVRGVVVGSDYKFGRQGSGNIAALIAFGKKYGFTVDEVSPATTGTTYDMDGDLRGNRINCARSSFQFNKGLPESPINISSSTIRDMITSGHTERAAMLLGRLYSLKCRAAPGAAPDAKPNTAAAPDTAQYYKMRRISTGSISTAGLYSAVMYPGAQMLAPAPGIYITAALANGAIYKGFARVGAELRNGSPIIRVTNYIIILSNGFINKNANYLQDGDFKIFFYKKIRGADVHEADFNMDTIPALQTYARAAMQYFKIQQLTTNN